jgi:O-antigen/teichoic acid export membrane protein
MCYQIINYTDNIIVGAVVGVAAVTTYTIAGGLLESTQKMVSGLGMGFLPLASSLDAAGRRDQVRRLLFSGTSATLLIALPLETTLFFRGGTFIRLWLGSEYGLASGRILQILLISQVFFIADYAPYNIACALNKHRPFALRLLGEAAANLALSIILARRMGAEGVAWGTVLPAFINHIILGPRYVCKILDVSAGLLIRRSWIPSFVAVIPFGIACYFADRSWSATNILQFGLQVLSLCPIFLLGVGLCFWKDVSEQLLPSVKWFIRSRNAAMVFVRRVVSTDVRVKKDERNKQPIQKF